MSWGTLGIGSDDVYIYIYISAYLYIYTYTFNLSQTQRLLPTSPPVVSVA